MDKIDLIGLEPFQTSFQDSLRLVGIARVDLCCQKDAFAPGFHYLPNPGFALAAAVAVGRVEVGDPEVQSEVESGGCLLLVPIGEKAAAAAHSQDGHLHPGSPQHSQRDRSA